MKNQHRFFALSALLAVSCTFLLGSCGDSETTAAADTDAAADDLTAAVTETAEPAARDRLEELGERDFGGLVYTVLDCNSAAYSNIPGASRKNVKNLDIVISQVVVCQILNNI